MQFSSSISSINDIKRSVNGYSTINTIGDLVVNEKFKVGYNEFATGQHTKSSYIWEALSAIS